MRTFPTEWMVMDFQIFEGFFKSLDGFFQVVKPLRVFEVAKHGKLERGPP